MQLKPISKRGQEGVLLRIQGTDLTQELKKTASKGDLWFSRADKNRCRYKFLWVKNDLFTNLNMPQLCSKRFIAVKDCQRAKLWNCLLISTHLLQLGQSVYSSKNSFLVQGLITISPKAINFTLTIQKIPRSIVYPIAEQILRSSDFFSSRTQVNLFTWQRSHQLSITFLFWENN